jgi:S1-C subfamily serine protease
LLVLTIRDARTGKDVPVEVQVPGRSAEPNRLPFPLPSPGANQPANASGPDGGRNRLGAVTEFTLYNVEAALKVTEVAPGSAAERAGIRPGMIIFGANGKPVLHPNDLAEIVRQSPATLQLSVFDPTSDRRGTVRVDLGG